MMNNQRAQAQRESKAMPSICDNNFTPDREDPGITDLIVLHARDGVGIRDATREYGYALGKFLDREGDDALKAFLTLAPMLASERYDDSPLFGIWDCEVNSRCYCAYARAGLSPLDHVLVADGDTITFLNPRTREVFDEHGTVTGHDTSGMRTGV